MELPQTSISGASGEHLVLSHLLKLNFVAGLAPYNTKDYDIIVASDSESNPKNIQVKTSLYQKKQDDMSKLYWILKEKHETEIKNLLFCFVYVSQESNDYKIFVLDSKIVSYLTTMSHKIWLKLPGPKGKKHKNPNMRRLASDYYQITAKHNRENLEDYLSTGEIKFLEKYKHGWLDEYENNWQLILNKS